MKAQEIIPKNLFTLLLLTSLISLLIIGCGDSSTDADTEEFDVQTVSTQSHGEVLADREGNVLYFFTPDVKGQSKCEGQCIENWPVFHTDELNLSEGLTPSDFGTISRPDGGNQSTFKGWPLYYFVGDEQPGDTNGDGVIGAWFVAKPDYSLMIASEQLVGLDDENYIIDDNGNYVVGEGTTTYFTDVQGRTLYTFANDSANTNNFTEEDFSNNEAWPIFHVDIETLPSAMNQGDFGEITVHDERQQLTYRGWPVYYFGQDMARGDNKGVSVGPEPGFWPVIQEDTPAAPEPENSNTQDDSNNNNDDDTNNGDGDSDSGY